MQAPFSLLPSAITASSSSGTARFITEEDCYRLWLHGCGVCARTYTSHAHRTAHAVVILCWWGSCVQSWNSKLYAQVCVCMRGVMVWRSRVLPCTTRCPCMVVRVVYPPFVSCVRFTLTCEIDTLADSVCPFGKGAEET